MLYKSNKQRRRGWGTILDYQDKVPTQFAGKSFYQPWHDDMDVFNKMSNKEKWEMGYWIEFQAQKSSGRIGLIVGLVLGVFLGMWTIALFT